MGVIRCAFRFMFGAAIGIYLAQNYDIPNINKLAHSYIDRAKQLEEAYRKRGSAASTSDDNDDSGAV